MRHLFVINPKSLRDKNKLEKVILEIENCFSVNRREEYKIYVSRMPRDAVTAVRKHIISLPPDVVKRVYAIGGDGVLFDCLNAIVGLPNVELASVPYGNSNDFIRSFGEGLFNDFRNIKNLLDAGTIPTDIIDSGTNTVINSIMVGIEGLTILNMWRFEIDNSLISKIGLYKNNFAVKSIICAILALFDYETRNQYYSVTVDGEDLSDYYVTINMSNGPCYGGSMTGAAEASPNDGLIDFIAVKTSSLMNMVFRDLPIYTSGNYKKFSPEKYVFRRAEQIHIKSETPLKVSADGEPYVANEITLNIRKKAINFVNVKGYQYRNGERGK